MDKIPRIRVFCGVSVEDKCSNQLHPFHEFENAKKIIDSNESVDIFSNSPDFVMSIFNYAELKNVPVEYFLNGESQGSSIEEIFQDFNSSYDEIHKLFEPCDRPKITDVKEKQFESSYQQYLLDEINNWFNLEENCNITLQKIEFKKFDGKSCKAKVFYGENH